MPKLLSLNVTDGGRRVQTLVADALASLAPDLVTIQEVRAATSAIWRSALKREGFHVVDTFDLAR